MAAALPQPPTPCSATPQPVPARPVAAPPLPACAGVGHYFANANCDPITMLVLFNSKAPARVYPLADVMGLPTGVLTGGGQGGRGAPSRGEGGAEAKLVVLPLFWAGLCATALTTLGAVHRPSVDAWGQLLVFRFWAATRAPHPYMHAGSWVAHQALQRHRTAQPGARLRQRGSRALTMCWPGPHMQRRLGWRAARRRTLSGGTQSTCRRPSSARSTTRSAPRGARRRRRWQHRSLTRASLTQRARQDRAPRPALLHAAAPAVQAGLRVHAEARAAPVLLAPLLCSPCLLFCLPGCVPTGAPAATCSAQCPNACHPPESANLERSYRIQSSETSFIPAPLAVWAL